MEKPAILAVDDEPAVLAAVARDLRREYGEHYRVLRAASGAEALELLRELRLREDPVALLVADQRMPGMTGVDLLATAAELFPKARRVLLTAYADTEVAIRAINQIRLDHYLMKPWDPPEERLYPVITDVLDDWQASFRPPFDGITIIGYRWSPDTHSVRDFLGRNQLPFRWIDVESDDARTLLDLAGASGSALPVVIFEDGSHLVQPSAAQIGERVGLKSRAQLPFYDLLIVGAGPAGLAAAVYGASEGLRTLLIEGRAPGGQAGLSSRIENYLGFPSGLSGGDLARRAVSQARRFGAEILTPREATGLRVKAPYHVLTLNDGSEVSGHSLLIATGVSYRRLAVPGADHLVGRGVYYGAALTEAMEMADRQVFVVGGGNSAGQAAMYLSQFAASVTLLVRGPSLAATMSQYLIDQIEDNERIHLRAHAEITEMIGDKRLAAIAVVDNRTGESRSEPADAVFIFIGAVPHTDWIEGTVQRNDRGFILAGSDLGAQGERPRGWTASRDPFWLETSVPGIFVAGDVRHRSVKRVASAVGEGAMAVQFIHLHLSTL